MTKNTALIKELRIIEEELSIKKTATKDEQEQFKSIRGLLRSLGEKPRDFCENFKFGDWVVFIEDGREKEGIFNALDSKGDALLIVKNHEGRNYHYPVRIESLKRKIMFPETVYTCHEGKVLKGFLTGVSPYDKSDLGGYFGEPFNSIGLEYFTVKKRHIFKTYNDAKKALNKVVIPERLKEIRNFRSSTRPATEADYISWLNSYLKNGGNIFDERPYEFPKDVYSVATESFKLPDMYGASSVKLIVPEGITVTYEKLGHNEIYFVEGGTSTNEYVEIYAGMLN